MFLISCIFRKSRSTKCAEKQGSFYITLSERAQLPDGTFVWHRSNLNTGLKSPDGVIYEEIRARLNTMVRVIYSIIESLTESGRAFDKSDVIEQFKLAMANDSPMQEIIRRAQTDFPLRGDLVRLGNDLKRDFRFVYSQSQSKPTAGSDTLTGFLNHKSIEFKNKGKNATARSYANTSGSLEKFNNGNSVKLSLVNRDYLIRYSEWLQGNGVSDSTQSFYLRTLRSALNHASEEAKISFEPNLFEGLNTKIYKVDKDKTSLGLSRELIRKIAATTFPADIETEIVRDIFMFAFYCHGLELSDVLNLKKSNISAGRLIFNRRQKGAQRVITLDDASIRIIDKYASATSDYIFPLMEKYQGLLYYSISERVRKSIKKIGKKVGYPTLSFSSNISAWHRIVSQLVPSDILLGHTC